MTGLTGILSSAADAYDPKKGWATCAQPIDGLPYNEFHEIAKSAVPSLRERITSFYTSQHMTVIEITPEELLDFETSSLQFRPWLNDHCKKTGKDSKADILIVVGTKHLDSCARKVANNPDSADRQRDYLRGMAVVLNPRGLSPSAIARKLGDCISSLENNEGTVARKNQFHTPNTTGYCGYKGIELVETSKDSELGDGFEILAEHKIELEGQMDAHKLTRRLGNVDRAAKGALSSFFETCTDSKLDDARPTSMGMSRLDNKTEILVELSRAIYAITRSSDGTLRFLDPAQTHLYKTPNPKAFRDLVANAQKAFGRNINGLVQESGIFSKLPKAQRTAFESALTH